MELTTRSLSFFTLFYYFFYLISEWHNQNNMEIFFSPVHSETVNNWQCISFAVTARPEWSREFLSRITLFTFCHFLYTVDHSFLGSPVDVTRIQGDVLGKYIICEELGRWDWTTNKTLIERWLGGMEAFCVGGWVNEWVSVSWWVWMSGWMGWVNEWVSVHECEQVGEWVSEWVWMSGWMDE